MGRIQEMFGELKGKRAALITYFTAFYPDEEQSYRIAIAMLECGSDALEIGIPFSDPILDGKVIQQTSSIALERGATLGKVLRLCERIRERTEKPLLLMGYCNPIYRYGTERFASDARECGVDGILIPDLPIDEIEPWRSALSSKGINTVTFCSVNANPLRIRKACDLSTGFIYCLSLLGTTGVRDELSKDVFQLVRMVKSCSTKPVVVGIGISNAQQCEAVGEVADGVVVGSALMQVVMRGGDYLSELKAKVRSFAEALARR